MTIEIHQPQLEALIQQRMASGLFRSVEDLLLQTLEAATGQSKKPGAAFCGISLQRNGYRIPAR